ncbi:MAG: hypothetical protein RL173_168 [Fibrobacterota bacterium]|jgi:carbonic anhydrase/acetyltransferase-like protein (isoleucine patch superfamily)
MLEDRLRRVLSIVASKITKRIFVIDPALPIGYLLFESVRRAKMMLYGLFRFRCIGVLASPSVKVRCRHLISFKGGLVLNDNVVIDALSISGVQFGRGVSVGKRVIIECTGTISSLGKGLVIGDRVGIGSSSFLGCAGGIEIGDDTILGNFVSLHSESHVFTNPEIPIRSQGVTRNGIKVGKGCWIGAKATILDGAVIGDNCLVAAGAVVLKGEYPSHVVLGGIPARVIKNLK